LYSSSNNIQLQNFRMNSTVTIMSNWVIVYRKWRNNSKWIYYVVLNQILLSQQELTNWCGSEFLTLLHNFWLLATLHDKKYPVCHKFHSKKKTFFYVNYILKRSTHSILNRQTEHAIYIRTKKNIFNSNPLMQGVKFCL
jgi:hypothetical protein